MILLLGEATSTLDSTSGIKDGRVSEASTDDEASRIERRLERNMFSCSRWVILSNLGGASALGTVGGAIWHGIKCAGNSPKGERLVGTVLFQP
ncbi:hypothetical protein EDC04DRAFT_2800056 [Pisolithus marmoratus]|nr:hypothetical protein EDC04DRAFT_2841921 [Pisolithus marmoratus]KAI5996101.1 hypothetical protein EDC04DRAFT_2800056 [Pisolithus marmoratus]